MFSKAQIHEVKERTDLVQLIESYVPLKKAGSRSFKACCPFHQEKTPSFNVNEANQFYHCFGCGAHGSALDFVMEIEGLNFVDALKLLANRAGVVLVDEKGPEAEAMKRKAKGRERLLELMSRVSQWYVSLLYTREGAIAKDYLKSRGLDEETVNKFGLGYSPDGWDGVKKFALSAGYTLKELLAAGLIIQPEGKPLEKAYDRFRGRLMFPIWDENGRVVGFSARTLKNENAKYINSPETVLFDKGKLLYAMPLAKPGIRAKNSAILCEGQLDVIACHRAGLTNAVAPQGTAFTPDQAKLLKRFTNKVIVAFDGDKAGQKAAKRCFEEMMAAELEMEVVAIPQGEDPDGVYSQSGAQGVQALMANPRDFFEVTVEQISENAYDTDLARSEAISELLEKLLLLPDAISRQLKIQKMAAALKMPESIIQEQFGKLQAAHARRAAYRERQQEERREETEPTYPSHEAIGYGEDERPPLEYYDSQQPAEIDPDHAFSGEIFNPEREDILWEKPDKDRKALLGLLDLGINHGFVAHRLCREFDFEVAEGGVVGDMLRELIGCTIQGDWQHVGQILGEHYKGRLPKRVGGILAQSDYDQLSEETEENQKKITAIVDDCLRTLRLSWLTRQEVKMRGLIKDAADAEEKRALYAEYRSVLDQMKQIRDELSREV